MYNSNRKYNYNQMYEYNQNEIYIKKILSDYACNIGWLLFIIVNFISAKYFEYVFNEFEENNECLYDHDCDKLLKLLIDKNYFLFDFMIVFGFVQILIFIISLISSKIKLINDFLSNIFGLVYMNSSLWYYSILYSYYYDIDFNGSYKFYMGNNYLFDPIRLSVYYYLIGEMVGFMVNFILVPLFLVGFAYISLSLLNAYFSIRSNFPIRNNFPVRNK